MSYVLSISAGKAPEPPVVVESVYVDKTFVNASGFTLNTGISPVPSDPTVWKVFRNGIRQNYGDQTGDWWIDSGNTIRFAWELFNDLIVISHPEAI